MAAADRRIIIVLEGDRNTDPLSFVRIDKQMKDNLLMAYKTAHNKNVLERIIFFVIKFLVQ